MTDQLYILHYSDGWCGCEETECILSDPANIDDYSDEWGRQCYDNFDSATNDRELTCQEQDIDPESEEGLDIEYEESWSVSVDEFNPNVEEHMDYLRWSNDVDVIAYQEKHYPNLEG